jgi:hypothetical protein
VHKELQDFFDEHENPTHCHTRDVHDLARPILGLVATAQRQVLLYRQMLTEAKYADHDGSLNANIERLRQKLAVLEAALPAFIQAGERIADSFTQWDALTVKAKVAIDQHNTIVATTEVQA